MTRFIFIHDFYRDGYNDMLAEVRVLQACGLWTRHKRASITRDAMSSYRALKHNFPSLDTSYWAGRLAALKSLHTAHFSEAKHVPTEHGQTGNRVVYLPLPPNADRFCDLFDCGSDAIWGACLNGDRKPFLVLCEPCRQEWVRTQTAYVTPDGWDWGEHEDSLLPQALGNKLLVKEEIEPASIFFPTTAVLGLGMLNLTLHIPITLFVVQAVLAQAVIVWGKDLLHKFWKIFESEL